MEQQELERFSSGSELRVERAPTIIIGVSCRPKQVFGRLALGGCGHELRSRSGSIVILIWVDSRHKQRQHALTQALVLNRP